MYQPHGGRHSPDNHNVKRYRLLKAKPYEDKLLESAAVCLKLHHTRRQNTPSLEANTGDATICATLNKCCSVSVTTVKHIRRCETHSFEINFYPYVHFWTQARLRGPCHLSRVDHVRKIRDRKQIRDIGKCSFVNRTKTGANYLQKL